MNDNSVIIDEDGFDLRICIVLQMRLHNATTRLSLLYFFLISLLRIKLGLLAR
jgi:hypothetical protein